MTCIVAIEKDGKVFMGADRMGSNGYTGAPVEEPKIFRNGPLLIGYTSSFRMGQLLRHALEVPVVLNDIDKWVSVDLMQAIRKAFKDNGWDREKEGQAEGGNFLIAVAGKCYEIQSDYSYIRNINGEYSVGSGIHYALGSLRSTRNNPNQKKRLQEALETASEYVVSVSAPYDFMEQKKP